MTWRNGRARNRDRPRLCESVLLSYPLSYRISFVVPVVGFPVQAACASGEALRVDPNMLLRIMTGYGMAAGIDIVYLLSEEWISAI
jgi:hypothetical protein